jgi:hypothetical protein
VACSYFTVSFWLLDWDKFMHVWGTINYFWHILIISQIFIFKMMPVKREPRDAAKANKKDN